MSSSGLDELVGKPRVTCLKVQTNLDFKESKTSHEPDFAYLRLRSEVKPLMKHSPALEILKSTGR